MRVLRKHELDAFLCTAVSPLLHDVETMQEMKVPAAVFLSLFPSPLSVRSRAECVLFMSTPETCL